jgi:hypothetical protein
VGILEGAYDEEDEVVCEGVSPLVFVGLGFMWASVALTVYEYGSVRVLALSAQSHHLLSWQVYNVRLRFVLGIICYAGKTHYV